LVELEGREEMTGSTEQGKNAVVVPTSPARKENMESTNLLLHVARVKGLAPVAILADMAGIPLDAATTGLTALAEQGHMEWKEGRFAGWKITPSGREAHKVVLDQEFSAPTFPKAALAEAYEGFSSLNTAFKTLCTAWQVREGTNDMNDHTDKTYDKAVIHRLEKLHMDARKAVDKLASGLPRLATYGPRLTSALARVQAGEQAAFARPMADSYHDIWMELHQDLLVTLQLERTAADH
jgi:hypothetical protein